MVAVTARSQILEWESQLKSMNENLVSVRALAEKECKAAYEALSESAVAFNALAIDVAARTKAMPDPTEQLRLMWNNIAGQEAQMVDAMSRVAGVLESLGTTTARVTEQFGALEADAKNSGVALVKGVSEVREGLQEQNRLLGDLVGEVVDVIEGRVNALAR
jgi:ABC-type transporter Mla subunit MlaD